METALTTYTRTENRRAFLHHRHLIHVFLFRNHLPCGSHITKMLLKRCFGHHIFAIRDACVILHTSFLMSSCHVADMFLYRHCILNETATCCWNNSSSHGMAATRRVWCWCHIIFHAFVSRRRCFSAHVAFAMGLPQS